MKPTLLIISLMIAGCSKKDTANKKSIDKGAGGDLYEYEFRGCHYIVYRAGYAGGLTHKGNCPNPIHRTDTCKCK